MELPFIAIKTADNQGDMAQYLKNNNHLILEHFNGIQFEKYLKDILK
jgi:hypothetical protein